MAGALLGEVTKIGQEANGTIVVLLHFVTTRLSNAADPATLEELSQAGTAEWARQWISSWQGSVSSCRGIESIGHCDQLPSAIREELRIAVA